MRRPKRAKLGMVMITPATASATPANRGRLDASTPTATATGTASTSAVPTNRAWVAPLLQNCEPWSRMKFQTSTSTSFARCSR